MKVIDKIDNLKKQIDEITDWYCDNCQEWDCSLCPYDYEAYYEYKEGQQNG